jgi:hypothetical protein
MQKHEMLDKIIQYQMRKITTAQVAKALDEYTAALRQPPVMKAVCEKPKIKCHCTDDDMRHDCWATCDYGEQTVS